MPPARNADVCALEKLSRDIDVGCRRGLLHHSVQWHIRRGAHSFARCLSLFPAILLIAKNRGYRDIPLVSSGIRNSDSDSDSDSDSELYPKSSAGSSLTCPGAPPTETREPSICVSRPIPLPPRYRSFISRSARTIPLENRVYTRASLVPPGSFHGRGREKKRRDPSIEYKS